MNRRLTRPAIFAGLLSALALFGVLGGTATAAAWWSTSVTVASTASAATVGISHSLAAAPSLAVTYTVAAPVAVGIITVTNTSTRTATYSTILSATTASSTLRAAVAVELGITASCTTTATFTSPQSGTLAAPVTYTGSLAAGTSAAICVRTRMTTAGVSANAGATLTATATTTARVGEWTATAAPNLSVTQAVATAQPSVVDPDAWYFFKRSSGEIRCAESKDFGTTSGTPVQTVDCNALAVNQLWRFTPTTAGFYAITNKNSPSLRWNVDNAKNGAALILSSATGSTSEWSVTAGSGATAIIAVRADSRFCASTDPNNGTRKAVKVKTCVAGDAEQALTLAMLGVANPAPVTLSCAADGFNATYSWPQLVGYELEVTYRVLVDGAVTTAYSRGTGYDPAVAFASTPALAALGVGTKAVEVQQKLASGVWHRVGTGSLTLSAATPYLACGG